MNLLERLQKRLATEPSLFQVAKVVGVNYNWLKNFRRGEIPEPGWSKVKKLEQHYDRKDKLSRAAATKARSKRSEAAKNRAA